MKRKTWFWLFFAVFLTTEIIFAFIPNFFFFILSESTFPSLATLIFPNYFFESNPLVIDLFLVLEYMSLIYLLIFNFRFNTQRVSRFLLSILLLIFLIILSMDVAITFAITNMGFP